SNHGRSREESRQFWANMVGFKYKMSNIQAALGCAQLERVDELIARKREIFMAYRDGFAGMPVTMNPEPDGCRNGYWMPTIVFEPQDRHLKDIAMQLLRERNIDARVFFHPLSDQGHFEIRHATPVSHDISSRAFNLPSYHDLTSADMSHVVETVAGCFGLDRPCAPVAGSIAPSALSANSGLLD
ncbi:MAG: DegT/DnrJ/EryC1/StrS family aminotransferase, partial [Rhodomicrobium sp.]